MNCTFNLTRAFFNSTCLAQIDQRIASGSLNPIVYVEALCQENDIQITTNNYISRASLGIVVVAFDVGIIVSFLLSFFALGHYENLENKEVN